MKKFIILIALLLFHISFVFADSQKDISSQEAVSIVKNYEKAYMNKNLNGMLEYVDQNSVWFKRGFLEEFKAIFQAFSNIRLYHWDKNRVVYVKDGVEIVQNTLYIAYSPLANDINELTENYYLKKVDGKYKIAEKVNISTKDVELVDKGMKALLENNVEEAISSFRKAIEYNPQNSAARCRLGTILSGTGKLQEGLRELTKIIELRPQVGLYRLFLSQTYNQLGDKEKGSEQLAQAFILDPELEVFVEKN